MRPERMPGEVFRTEYRFGLTFDEILVLGGLPVGAATLSLFIKELSAIFTVPIALVMAGVGVIIILRAPPGQSPIDWMMHALRRRVLSTTYTLRMPRSMTADVEIANKTHTNSPMQTSPTTHSQSESPTQSSSDDAQENTVSTSREAPSSPSEASLTAPERGGDNNAQRPG